MAIQAAGVLGGECCHANRDEYAGQFDDEFGDVAGRSFRWEPPRVFLVEPTKSGGLVSGIPTSTKPSRGGTAGRSGRRSVTPSHRRLLLSHTVNATATFGQIVDCELDYVAVGIELVHQ